MGITPEGYVLLAVCIFPWATGVGLWAWVAVMGIRRWLWGYVGRHEEE